MMTKQESVDQTYQQQVDDYMTWDIHLLGVVNLFHYMELIWLMPAMEDVSVLEVQTKREKYCKMWLNDLPF